MNPELKPMVERHSRVMRLKEVIRIHKKEAEYHLDIAEKLDKQLKRSEIK